MQLTAPADQESVVAPLVAEGCRRRGLSWRQRVARRAGMGRAIGVLLALVLTACSSGGGSTTAGSPAGPVKAGAPSSTTLAGSINGSASAAEGDRGAPGIAGAIAGRVSGGANGASAVAAGTEAGGTGGSSAPGSTTDGRTGGSGGGAQSAGAAQPGTTGASAPGGASASQAGGGRAPAAGTPSSSGGNAAGNVTPTGGTPPANGAVSPAGSSGVIGPAAAAGDLAAFCPAWRTLDSRLKGVDAQAGPSQLRASVAAARAAIAPALGAAPGQVRGDVQVVTDAYGQLFAALDQAGYDVSKVSLGAIQGFSPSVVNAAAGRVASYVAANC